MSVVSFALAVILTRNYFD